MYNDVEVIGNHVRVTDMHPQSVEDFENLPCHYHTHKNCLIFVDAMNNFANACNSQELLDLLGQFFLSDTFYMPDLMI